MQAKKIVDWAYACGIERSSIFASAWDEQYGEPIRPHDIMWLYRNEYELRDLAEALEILPSQYGAFSGGLWLSLRGDVSMYMPTARFLTLAYRPHETVDPKVVDEALQCCMTDAIFESDKYILHILDRYLSTAHDLDVYTRSTTNETAVEVAYDDVCVSLSDRYMCDHDWDRFFVPIIPPYDNICVGLWRDMSGIRSHIRDRVLRILECVPKQGEVRKQ